MSLVRGVDLPGFFLGSMTDHSHTHVPSFWNIDNGEHITAVNATGALLFVAGFLGVNHHALLVLSWRDSADLADQLTRQGVAAESKSEDERQDFGCKFHDTSPAEGLVASNQAFKL